MASKEIGHFLAEANNDFGLNLHLKLVQKDTNVFFSPFSVSVALSMLLRGAEGDTAAEIKHGLGFESVKLDDTRIHQSFHDLLNAIAENSELYTLAIANAIVAQKGFAIVPDYVSDLQKIYKAMVMEANFANESSAAVKKINQWVSENTNGKIPTLLTSLNPATVIVLLNAVYFKGTWQDEFDPDDTHDGPFYNRGLKSQEKVVPLMNKSQKCRFVEKGEYKALELPYKGDHIAMLLLLPNKMEGLKKLEKSLDQGFLPRIRAKLIDQKVKVTLPKLHLEYSNELVPILESLGMVKMLGSAANLKGMSNSEQLSVSSVIHKAALDVNEEGSEAAAATAIVMLRSAGIRAPKLQVFRVDHPFVFVIFDKRNNLILFMGRVEEL